MQVNITLDIPKEIYNKYNGLAQNKNLSKVLSQRLVDCVEHTAEKGIFLNDFARQQLEKSLGYNIDSAGQLIGLVQRMSTVSIDDIPIQLEADTLSRLKSRCFDGVDFTEFLRDRIVKDLETFVGLR